MTAGAAAVAAHWTGTGTGCISGPGKESRPEVLGVAVLQQARLGQGTTRIIPQEPTVNKEREKNFT
jgi:hypothetical protein